MTLNEIPSVYNLPIEKIAYNYTRDVVYATLIKQYESDYTIVIPEKTSAKTMDSSIHLRERETIELVANKCVGEEKIYCEDIYTEPGIIYGYRHYASQNQYKVLLPNNCIYVKASFQADYASGSWAFEIFSSLKDKAVWDATGNLGEANVLENKYENFRYQVRCTAQTISRKPFLRCV